MSTPTSSARVRGLIASRMFDLLAEANRSAALDLALGVPGAPHPSALVLDAACRAVREGPNQYEVAAGNASLRQWIAETLPGDVDPDTEVTITVGASEALTAATLAVLDPGDEVIVFEPYYENFVNAVVLAGAVPRFVPCRAPEWRFDPGELRAAFGPRTRALIVSTPNNPTGHMLAPDEWDEIARLCRQWNTAVISDEIYAGFTFTRTHHSVLDVPELAGRRLLIGSFSKSHAVSGWRIGYLYAEAELAPAVRQIHATLCAGAPAPLQAALAHAAAHDPSFAAPADDLKAQCDRVIRLLRGIGLHATAPDGGCYIMAETPPGTDSDSVARRLLREAGVLVAPGSLFHLDAAAGAGHLRVAFNRSMRFLDQADNRLASFPTPDWSAP